MEGWEGEKEDRRRGEELVRGKGEEWREGREGKELGREQRMKDEKAGRGGNEGIEMWKGGGKGNGGMEELRWEWMERLKGRTERGREDGRE